MSGYVSYPSGAGLEASHPIVMACDQAYAMPLATAIRSIVDANKSVRPLDFYVLSEDFSEETRRRVRESIAIGSASIHWVDVDLTLFAQFSTIEYISKMTYARFLIPRIFAKTVSRVLYLDADVLVLDDLDRLWQTDLGDSVVGAVLDRGIDPKLKLGQSEVEGVPKVRDYFNAGVLLLDLDRWREERISEKAMAYLNEFPRSPFSDQDALNVACDGLWKTLDPRWNCQDHHQRRFADIDPELRPGIIHFVTSLKPWDASRVSLNAGFYNAFRCRTCFARTNGDKLTDMFQGMWSRLKHFLKRSAYIRIAWSEILRVTAKNRRIA